MANTYRIEGLQELIQTLDEAIERAERIKAAYFDDSRNEGWHLVDDLGSLKRRLAQGLADELAELEDE